MNERLRLLLAEMLDLAPGDVTPEMRRGETDGWDSLNHLRLITAVEAEFGASLTMDEIAELQTPAELECILNAHSSAQAHA